MEVEAEGFGEKEGVLGGGEGGCSGGCGCGCGEAVVVGVCVGVLVGHCGGPMMNREPESICCTFPCVDMAMKLHLSW